MGLLQKYCNRPMIIYVGNAFMRSVLSRFYTPARHGTDKTVPYGDYCEKCLNPSVFPCAKRTAAKFLQVYGGIYF